MASDDWMDHETQQQIGWMEVWNLFQCASAPGERHREQLRPFRPSEEACWREDQNDLRLMQGCLEDHNFADRLIQAIHKIPTIEPLIAKLEAGQILQHADLFKWKQWMQRGSLLTEIVEEIRQSICAKAIADSWLSWWMPPDWEPLKKILNPQSAWTDTFSLDDAYDGELQQIRRRKRRLQQQIDGLRKEQIERLRIRYGKLPNRDRQYIWQREARKMIDSARTDPELELLGETSWEVLFAIRDTGTAQSLQQNLDMLEMKEAEREQMVLASISRQLSEHAASFRDCETAWGRLDWLLARIAAAKRRKWTFPIWTDDDWQAEEAYHPLLAEALRKQGRQATPVSFSLPEGVSVLTGPNMGGKTVSLRTAGLLQALAQYGMPVPAVRFRFVPVDQIRFVGGDLQSMQDGMSTFGAEVARLSELLQGMETGGQSRKLEPSSKFEPSRKLGHSRKLLLLDEVGRGTNPREGEALAAGLIRFLQQSKWRVWFATHYPEVSAISGIMRWQVAGLADHRIIPSDGQDSSSESLTIAKQMGLPQEIVEFAEQWLTDRETRTSRKGGSL